MSSLPNYCCIAVFFFLLLPHSLLSNCTRPPVIFNFGDSNSDTGGLVAGLGFHVNLPNGRAFFGKSTGRLSDGRLIIDFLCQSLKTSLLSPYLESLSSNFSNGANFAIVGSSALPKNVPFALNIQVKQFAHFKARSAELVNADNKIFDANLQSYNNDPHKRHYFSLETRENTWKATNSIRAVLFAPLGVNSVLGNDRFSDALYVIDIGQNDLADSFTKGLSYVQVFNKIPSVLAEIEDAVKEIYDQGGRKFWVHNTGPLGCLPQKLAQVQNDSLDSFGCISSYNEVAQLFNEGLRKLCQELRSDMKDVSVVYVDVYSIKLDIIANSSTFGFSSPLMACCGSGGPPYNYDKRVSCGFPGYQVCDQQSQFVSWDGVHYTEAANAIIASKILSADYSMPNVNFEFFCR